jgi:glycosyltransferase involved in cell wall biosynthesis
MLQIARLARVSGHKVRTFSKRWKYNPVIEEHQYIGSLGENVLHRIGAPLLGADGAFSVCATRRLIRQLEAFAPDVVHLHNLHGWFLNYEMLMDYLKKKGMRVIWTFHDCWPFTGQCPHFLMADCKKWKTGCHHCPQFREYPETCLDRTKVAWEKKRVWFTGFEDLTIVTPSAWLSELVEEPFLKGYPVRVIHNGIDLTVYRPTESDFRKKYGCEYKHLVLGVAANWGKRKGLDVFAELAQRLDTSYQIILVGTDDKIDQKLPDNIISIHSTQNQKELAELYSAADVFVNPTREDTFPTVNIEALACGTPVLTFRTGGSPEIVDHETGCVVDRDDVDAMRDEIIRICTQKPFSQAACLRRAAEFDKEKCFKEYLSLYEND